MTRQEAIDILGGFIVIDNKEADEALDMAKKALQHEQERREDIYKCSNCTGEVHKNYMYCPFCGIKVGDGW